MELKALVLNSEGREIKLEVADTGTGSVAWGHGKIGITSNSEYVSEDHHKKY